MRTPVLLLLGGAAGARGWAVGLDASADVLSADPRLARWSAPPSFEQKAGLGGGIAWAWAPRLCDELLPAFPEETELHGPLPLPRLITCDELRRMVLQAMAQWEAANHNVRFFDVTQQCEGHWSYDRGNSTAEECDARPATCKSCARAELVIGAFRPDRLGRRAPAEVVVHAHADAPLVAASDYDGDGGWLRGDVTTGEWVGGFAPLDSAPGRSVSRATLMLSIAPSQCWWVDADMCESFFAYDADGGDTEKLANGVTWTAFGLGVLFVFVQCCFIIYSLLQTMLLHWDTDGDGYVEVHEVYGILKEMFKKV